MKMNKENLIKSVDSVFNSVYSDINHISDNNLDGYLKYYTDDKSRLEVRNHYEKNYLLYRKSDRDLIQKILPISNYVFDKVIQKWFSKKYDIDIDGVLLPKK